MAKARVAKRYRADAADEALAAGIRRINADRLHMRITFFPPDKRRRDLDNMLASIKPGLDGLSDVVGVDDHRWSITIQRADPVKMGRVQIEILEV